MCGSRASLPHACGIRLLALAMHSPCFTLHPIASAPIEPAPHRLRTHTPAFAVVSRRVTRQRLRQIRILPVPRRIARSTISTVRPTAPNTTAWAAAYTPAPNVTRASPPCAPTDHPWSASRLCDLPRPPVPGAVGQLGPASVLVGVCGGLGRQRVPCVGRGRGRGGHDLGGARVVRGLGARLVRHASELPSTERSELIDCVATMGITRHCRVRANAFSSPLGSSSPTLAKA